MTDLEKMLCKYFNSPYCVYTGNATTAMYLVFKTLRLRKKRVIFPAITCTNPVNAALYAGWNVDFCDVQLKDYTMDLKELEKMLQTNLYSVIVPTHIYGHRYDERILRKLAQKYNVILFEDAAQSYYIGDSDISVMSFGHTKICESQFGGGVVFTCDENFFLKLQKERKNIPLWNENIEELNILYRKRYYDIIKKEPDWKIRNERLKNLQMQSKECFIYHTYENTELIYKLKCLEKNVDEREKKTKLYDARLNPEFVIKPDTQSLCRWRYTFIYKGNRNFLVKQAREKGIDISNWYPSLEGIYKGKHMKIADQIENHVVNLWIDKLHSIDQIQKEIKVLNQIMESDYGRDK